MQALVYLARKQLPANASVIEFGNQRFRAMGNYASTAAFYRSLGFSYLALDVNEEMGAVIADLNEPVALPAADLPTTAPASISSISACVSRMRTACASRRLMIHCPPFHP